MTVLTQKTKQNMPRYLILGMSMLLIAGCGGGSGTTSGATAGAGGCTLEQIAGTWNMLSDGVDQFTWTINSDGTGQDSAGATLSVEVNTYAYTATITFPSGTLGHPSTTLSSTCDSMSGTWTQTRNGTQVANGTVTGTKI